MILQLLTIVCEGKLLLELDVVEGASSVSMLLVANHEQRFLSAHPATLEEWSIQENEIILTNFSSLVSAIACIYEQ